MALLSLAVGIGANTAIFSLVDGVLLRPLAFRDPEQLVAITLSSPQFRRASALPINIGQLVEWRKRATAFESIGAYQNITMSLTGEGRPELIPGAAVSANFFRTLGISPRIGRSFLDQEDLRGRHQVALLADSLWRRRFGADPNIVGRKAMLSGASYQIIGVLPADFDFPRQPDNGHHINGRMEIFRPLGYSPDDTVFHVGDLNYAAIARLKPEVTIDAARSNLTAVESAMDREIKGWQMIPAIEPLQASLTGDVRRSLIVLMAAVGAVLLVLCVNLANLSLSRAAGRARDAAIRTALGASRGQLVRQSLAESAVLAALGGALGIGFATYALKWLVASAPVDLPRLAGAALDMRVLIFAVGVSLATGLFFGVLPALRSASQSSPYETLKSGSRSNTEGRGGARVRNLLVGFEVGLCAALLVTAGLFISSFLRLTTIDKGFDVERVVAVDVGLPYVKYTNEQQRGQFFERLLAQAKALPGVESAATSSYLPLQGETWVDVLRVENDPRPDTQWPATNLRWVSPGIFRTLRIPFRAGRDFEERDRDHMVAIISENLGRKLWPKDNPLGRKLVDLRRTYEVIGIVGDARSASLDKDPVDTLYLPVWHRSPFSSSILVRTAMDPKGIANALRAAVWSADADIPVPPERTLVQVMAESVARRRFQTMLVMLFALGALALAAFGTYGVVSYSVARRRSEIGIRMALGAGQGNVLSLVMRQGMLPVFAGLAAGAVAALWIGQYVSSLLFQVSPRDPVAFALASGVLIAVSAAACWIPARRATRVNPIEALHFD
jgi:predicted permease